MTESNILLILIGGVLPQAFITPPKNIGTYVISHFENTGSFCPPSSEISIVSNSTLTSRCINFMHADYQTFLAFRLLPFPPRYVAFIIHDQNFERATHPHNPISLISKRAHRINIQREFLLSCHRRCKVTRKCPCQYPLPNPS